MSLSMNQIVKIAGVVRDNREQLYLEKARKSYRDWIESKALFDAYRHRKNRGGLEINYHAIQKSREKREMDEVDGNSNRFAVEKSSV